MALERDVESELYDVFIHRARTAKNHDQPKVVPRVKTADHEHQSCDSDERRGADEGDPLHRTVLSQKRVRPFCDENHRGDVRQKEPSIRLPDLVKQIQERFGTKVHPRSIERSLLRHQKKRR